ncbi:AraC family transcriptional regulator [Pseudomonas sp.]|uniref:AraC family transcriptional regulator n=1 Tax=Pseudomonas sp. TaxID=306 RepID=UPI0039C9072B
MTIPLENAWHYQRTRTQGVEIGCWNGASAPMLRSHFHREVQITFVLSGSRQFRIKGQNCRVDAGQCLIIPPGVPHQSLPHVHAGTTCINVYLSALATQQAALLIDAQDVVSLDWHEPISKIAQHAGMSREAFTRCFSHRVGMPPGAFRIVDRLNHARQRLQEGTDIADLAVELGFADQSHFGRHFRRTFGISPGVYRDIMRESQTF